MNIYYTNTVTENEEQKKPELSLGGFISSKIVPNDYFGNIFSDISSYTVDNNLNEYIGLMLKNEQDNAVSNILVYFDFPVDAISSIEIAAVTLNVDKSMEILNNRYSAPYVGTFAEADGVVNAINIGGLESQSSIGLWFKRVLDIDTINDNNSCSTLYSNLGTDPETVENISFKVSWTDV